MKKVYAIFAIIATLAACSNPLPIAGPVYQPEPVPKLKNVFLFIGDGMSFAHIAATEAFLASESDIGVGNVSLSFTQFPVMGMATTYSANSYITCSSAAATALSTGVKINNGMLGIDPSGNFLRSIAFDLKDAGYRIGIATTVSMDHATPAAFYANEMSRDNYYAIASQVAPSNFDFFAGEEFLDPGDVYEKLSEAGYSIARTNEDLALPSQKMLMVQGNWTLADFTRTGIERLDNPQGFFFMIEGGKIDWASHDNDAAGMIRETIGFSQAVAVAVDFYKNNPSETLIIITADHGTGGIALLNNGEYGWSTKGHTGEAVPVFAIGIGSELFAGKMDNTDIPKRIMELSKR